MLLIVSAAVPVLVKVALCAALVVPMFCNANVSAPGKPEIRGVSRKLALTDLAASMVIVQVAAAPALAQAPPQEMRLTAGLAVSVTENPLPATPLQAVPQLIGPPVTLPAPVLTTLNGTVS